MVTRKNKKKSKNVVVLLSGGLDSTTIAYLAKNKSAPYSNNRVFTLTFDYGQRHKKELNSALKISKEIGAADHKVINFDLTLWGGSALTDEGIDIPKNRKLSGKREKLTLKSIPITYVPARNTIFLSFALAYAEAVKAQEIYIGVNSVDYSGYIDCRPLFIRKFQELIKAGTVVRFENRPIKIKTPLINLTKAQIIKLGEKLGVNWANTWSCYMGGKYPCGECDSCQLRLKGFMQAGVKDALKYKKLPDFYKNWISRKSKNLI